MVKGLDIPAEKLTTKLKCHSCMAANQSRVSYGNATTKSTTENCECLTTDVCDMGKYVPGLGAVRYFQHLHDEGSRYKCCLPLNK